LDGTPINTLREQTGKAILQMQRRLDREDPWFSRQVWQWMTNLSFTTRLADYLLGVSMFPMLRIPRWLTSAIPTTANDVFQASIVYSTINGYLYIRLMDNVMDGHSGGDPKLLPIAAFFHTEFIRTYQEYFEYGHRFWSEFFYPLWLTSHASTAKDADASDIDFEAFRTITANKLCAAKIPVVAVCCFYDLHDRVRQWQDFVDSLAVCWQFADDLFDWQHDLQAGACTYFLSEGRRQKNRSESMEGWVVREGFTWGIEMLRNWLPELCRGAACLESRELDRFLKRRISLLDAHAGAIAKGLKNLALLSPISEEVRN
jgi:hypothetical protein